MIIKSPVKELIFNKVYKLTYYYEYGFLARFYFSYCCEKALFENFGKFSNFVVSPFILWIKSFYTVQIIFNSYIKKDLLRSLAFLIWYVQLPFIVFQDSSSVSMTLTSAIFIFETTLTYL